MKHAFLILAHDKEEVLRELLSSFDDPRCDVFLHIDSKSYIDHIDINTQFPNVNILDRRIDARWGDYSLVEIEVALLEEALAKDSYHYLHIISGVDYPLHSMDYIIDFCKTNAGKEFIGFATNDDPAMIKWRSGRRFLFSRDFRTESYLKKLLRHIHARLQSLPGLGNKINAEVKRGAQWCSITADFAKYVVDNKSWLKRNFHSTYCPDEMALQTLSWNSRFRKNIFDLSDEFHGCMRYIPWHDSELCSFSDNDFSNMKVSEAFFARKFTLADIKRFKNGNC